MTAEPCRAGEPLKMPPLCRTLARGWFIHPNIQSSIQQLIDEHFARAGTVRGVGTRYTCEGRGTGVGTLYVWGTQCVGGTWCGWGTWCMLGTRCMWGTWTSQVDATMHSRGFTCPRSPGL